MQVLFKNIANKNLKKKQILLIL